MGAFCFKKRGIDYEYSRIQGYKGTIETEDDTLFGHVLGLKNAIISYEGKNIDELRDDFQNGIDDYLENCRLNGERRG
ncbi:hypothetical protein [Lactobacillus gallinarum]|uniref:hypothetical protein n=1 Tax=Lactobacillus gallinarum TaxID=52242 RepID=UPI0024B10A33|nr:hypothetical protein [Lactobacillus gallinarum]